VKVKLYLWFRGLCFHIKNFFTGERYGANTIEMNFKIKEDNVH